MRIYVFYCTILLVLFPAGKRILMENFPAFSSTVPAFICISNEGLSINTQRSGIKTRNRKPVFGF